MKTMIGIMMFMKMAMMMVVMKMTMIKMMVIIGVMKTITGPSGSENRGPEDLPT